jgi:hypothetical protein
LVDTAAAGAPGLVVKTDAGALVAIVLDPKTTFLRVKPGAATLTDAQPSSLADIGVGDRVLARGSKSADGKSVAARQVVQMTRTDLTDKQDKERADWRRRGVVGVVTALDSAKREVTLSLRSASGAETLQVAMPEGSTVFRRYAPDSVKWSDARPSSFEELRVGDQLRALGDRSADNAHFAAEQVVSGAFRNVTGIVESVDAAQSTLVLHDTASEQRITVRVGADTLLRKLPAFGAMGGSGGAGLGGGGWRGGAGAAGGGAGAAGGSAGSGRRGGIGGDMLERMPAITLAEIAPGNAVAVSSTAGEDASHMTAIALLTGLEALAAPRSRGRRGGETDLGLPQGILDISIGLP